MEENFEGHKSGMTMSDLVDISIREVEKPEPK
jgi:hypothetical protein